MNIDWLKKTEKKLGESDSRFCICFDRLAKKAIELVYNEQSTDGIDFSTLPSGYCHQCDLPVDSEKIESINRQIDLILPSYGAIETMPKSASAKETVEGELPGELPGLLPVEVSRRLQISLSDVNRHIRSGRLSLDASGKFVTQDSLNELQKLIRGRNGEN